MGITVSGQMNAVMAFNMPSVSTMYNAAPTQVSTGQFPVFFIRNMRIENLERNLTFARGSLNSINFEIVILIEAARQSNQFDTYTLGRTIMDELASELEENAALIKLDSYNILETFETAGESTYFAVVGDVRTSG